MSTALLAHLKVVFVDGSTPVVSRPTLQPLAIPQYASGHILVTAVNSDGTSRSLVGVPLLLGVRLHPTDAAPAISLQATNVYGDPENEARFELVAGHWLGVPPRMYEYDIIAVVDTEDRPQVLPASPWRTTDENIHPGDAVSVPTSQLPLAQGPPGPTGPTGATGPAGPPPAGITYPAILRWDGSDLVWKQRETLSAVFDGTVASVRVDWVDFVGRTFRIVGGTPQITDAAGPITVYFVDLSSAGCVVQASDVFEGQVDLAVEEI